MRTHKRYDKEDYGHCPLAPHEQVCLQTSWVHCIFIFFALLVSDGYIELYPGSIGNPNYGVANVSYSVSALSTIGFDNTVSNYLIAGNFTQYNRAQMFDP